MRLGPKPLDARILAISTLFEEHPTLGGFAAPQFMPVAEAFVANFRKRREVGACVSVIHQGKTVVDLWMGHENPAKTLPWQAQTILPVFSNTKVATALCLHKLVDEGKVDLDAPVATYWPEFAAKGKGDIRVSSVLNHSAGLPALRRRVPHAGFRNWDFMVKALAAEEPFWEPGSTNGYHMISFGWLVGEIVQRVSGMSLGDYFDTHIRQPTGAEFYIGLPRSEYHRFAPVILQTPSFASMMASPFLRKIVLDQKSIPFLSLINSGRFAPNKPIYWPAHIGGAGGIGNARGMAAMYAPLAENDGSLLSQDGVERLRRPSMETKKDLNLGVPTRFSLGAMLRMDNSGPPRQARSLLIPDGAFGHTGIGGSISFADPDQRIAFGYAMTRLGIGFFANERGQSLIDAVYESLN